MNDRYRLVALGNEQLLAALKGLVRREHVAMADMLAHLAELYERRLYLDLGYSSLFTYCREALGFCKSSAGRRIAAARVCRQYPEAFLRLAKGELQLSVLSALGSYLDARNAAELLNACSGKSFEQVEELLAARFPRPDVRDSIRRLPDFARRAPDMGSENRPGRVLTTVLPVTGGPANAELAAIVEQTTIATQTAIATVLGPEQAQLERRSTARAERVEPLSSGRFGVHFTADAEFRELLEEVRALASHQQPGGQLLPLMKRALEAYRRELRKKRFGVGAKPRTAVASCAVPPIKRTRRVSAAVTRAVYKRDSGSCTFMSEDGRRCAERQLLELDHIQPWALDGESTIDNLRLRCRAHNQHAARAHFGNDHIRAAVARARSRGRQKPSASRDPGVFSSDRPDALRKPHVGASDSACAGHESEVVGSDTCSKPEAIAPDRPDAPHKPEVVPRTGR